MNLFLLSACSFLNTDKHFRIRLGMKISAKSLICWSINQMLNKYILITKIENVRIMNKDFGSKLIVSPKALLNNLTNTKDIDKPINVSTEVHWLGNFSDIMTLLS